jgi:prepilin-type N-terminal cleavage/methylation domain-containing protein
MGRISHPRGGFTLIELMIVLGIIVMLLSLVTFSFRRTWFSGNMEATVDEINQALYKAQVESISGVSEDGTSASNFGVRFEQGMLIVFPGSVYVSGADGNEEISWNEGLRLTTINLPDQSVVFSRVSGEVENYTVGQNSLVLTNSQTGESETLVINRMGTMEVQ